uniref:Calreticulin n=1 Tax=Oryza meridionalis TaxID=40149 RepID=A0A0E0EP25_9ORYZ
MRQYTARGCYVEYIDFELCQITRMILTSTLFDSSNHIGIELWQVKSGTLFDNILITDDPEYAKKFAEETWAKHKDAEKTAFDEAEKRRLEEDDEDEADDDKADVVAEQTKGLG